MPKYYARKRVNAYGFLLPEVGHQLVEEWLLWLFCLEAIENSSGFTYEIC